MPYALNVISVESDVPALFSIGELVAEPDSPPNSILVIGDQKFAGMRYLIVSDDGTGYKSGMRLVSVPANVEEPSRIIVDPEFRHDLRALLTELLEQSPRKQLVLYLEANRIISKSHPKEEFPVLPGVHAPMSLSDVLSEMDRGNFVEEEIFVVHED